MKSWRPSQKETKMMTNSKAGQSLRRTALSAAMLLIAAPAALADPPGYLFRDFADPAPATASAPIAPLQRNAANQEAARLASARAFANVAESSPRMAQEHQTSLFRSEIVMSRIILISSFAALLAACGIQSANQTASTQARLACADLGVDPGGAAFGQCASDLEQSLWNEQALSDR